MADYVRVEGVSVIKSMDKAILCEISGEKIWIPLSQVGDDSEVREEGDEGDLVITEWIAGEKGIA